MSFFPLPHRVDIYEDAPTTNRSGQKSLAWSIRVAGVKALFYTTTGSRNTQFREDYTQTVDLYLEGTVDIHEGDQIRNVTGKGVVVESGIYLVESVKKITDFSGNIHHITCKLKGVSL